LREEKVLQKEGLLSSRFRRCDLVARIRAEFLSRQEIDRIHDTSMRLLENVGVLMHSKSVQELLLNSGSKLSSDGKRVLMPEGQVKEAIRVARRPVVLASRDGKNDMKIPNPDRMFVANGGEGVFVKNLVTGESHSTTSDDLRDFAILVNELPQIDFFWPMVGALEQPVHLKGITEFKVSLTHTTKHIQSGAISGQEARLMIEMASIFTGGPEELAENPIFSTVECPISPMTFEKGLAEAQVEFARADVPVVAMTASVEGLTSPITISGTLAQVNAENLASLVMSQAAKPGSPFIYSSDSSPGDLKTGSIDYGALEVPLIRIGAGQMGRNYKLPTMVAGVGTENLAHAMVSEWDGMSTMAIQSMVPSDLASGLGGIDMATGASLEQLVVDAWIWKLARQFAREFDAGEEAISYETIRDASMDGNFLGKRHTMSRFRKEAAAATMPCASISERMRPGKPGDLIAKGRVEVEKLLGETRGPLATKQQIEAMENVIKKAG